MVCTESKINQLINSIYGTLVWAASWTPWIKFPEGQEEEGASKEEVQVSTLQDLAGEAPVVRLVNSIFAQAIRDGASDVHISPQQNSVQLRFRIDGKLMEVPSPPKALFLPIVARMKILGNMDITISRIPQDGRFTLKLDKKEINVRVSSIPTIYGENLVLRLLDTSSGAYSLDRLGMIPRDMEKIENVTHKPYGMVLSTGPTGSGKSTSLYAILSSLNKPDINIMTLEDPVEYRINNIRQIQLNRKAGMTFADGLRSILRQDPDVIMVGEIRMQKLRLLPFRPHRQGTGCSAQSTPMMRREPYRVLLTWASSLSWLLPFCWYPLPSGLCEQYARIARNPISRRKAYAAPGITGRSQNGEFSTRQRLLPV